jgi:hypothetical protein
MIRAAPPCAALTLWVYMGTSLFLIREAPLQGLTCASTRSVWASDRCNRSSESLAWSSRPWLTSRASLSSRASVLRSCS